MDGTKGQGKHGGPNSRTFEGITCLNICKTSSSSRDTVQNKLYTYYNLEFLFIEFLNIHIELIG